MGEALRTLGTVGGGIAGFALGGPLGAVGGALGGGALGGLFGGNEDPFARLNPVPTPDFIPGFTPDQAIAPGVQEQLGQINVDPRALEAVRTEAFRQGPSPFTQLQQRQLGTQISRQQGAAAQSSASLQAQARGQLASRGGLSGGARQALAQTGLRSTLAEQQRIAGQGITGQQQLAISGEQRRLETLGRLPGAELAQLAPEFQKVQFGAAAQQFDVGQRVAEAGRQNVFNLALTEQQNQREAALIQAQATQGGGKKG